MVLICPCVSSCKLIWGPLPRWKEHPPRRYQLPLLFLKEQLQQCNLPRGTIRLAKSLLLFTSPSSCSTLHTLFHHPNSANQLQRIECITPLPLHNCIELQDLLTTYHYIAVLSNGRLPPREAQKSSHISNALPAQSSAAVVGMQCLTHSSSSPAD